MQNTDRAGESKKKKRKRTIDKAKVAENKKKAKAKKYSKQHHPIVQARQDYTVIFHGNTPFFSPNDKLVSDAT